MKSREEKQLIVLAEWCKNYSSSYDSYTEGITEGAVRRGVDEAINMVGDLMQEIMGATPELLDEYYKDAEKPCTTDIIISK